MTLWNRTAFLGAVTALSLVACQSEQPVSSDDPVASIPVKQEDSPRSDFISIAENQHLGGASPRKPSAPVTIRYRISDEAIIGQPLDIELQFLAAAPIDSIQVQYRSLDLSALAIQHDQATDVKLSIGRDSDNGLRRVTVIPQAQGRSYLWVSASVETPAGIMTKATSIPIQVGTGGPRLETNGELLPAADGATVISLPAKED